MTTPTHRAAKAEMQERMFKFSSVYNSGWLVRHSMFTRNAIQRRQRIEDFWAVLTAELKTSQDHEALLYAACDAITSNPLGLPWEG